jgi:hypothetical protein
MSADNGVYILVTTTGDGSEYRVAHAQAIENIYWNDDIKDFGEKPNFFEIWRYFKGAQVLDDERDALEVAAELLRKQHVCEYGIEMIDAVSDKYWSEIVSFAKRDPDFERVSN